MSKTIYEAKAPVIDDFCDPEPQEEKFSGFPCFLFTQKEFSKSGSRDKMLCRCAHCGKTFWKEKHFLQRNVHDSRPLVYCSYECSVKHRTILAEQKHPHPDEYVCKTCGKTVKWKDKYGNGRFCCEKCARSFSGKIANSEEAKRKKSSTLKKRYVNSVTLKHKPSQFKKQHNPFLDALRNDIINNIDKIKGLQQWWNLTDIAKMYHLTFYQAKILYSHFGIKEKDCYISSRQTKVIETCRHALGKPFAFGSITKDDFALVQNVCSELMHQYDWNPVQVCSDFLGMSFPYLQFIPNCLKVKLKTPGESVRSYHRKKGTYRNMESKKKYKMECEFHMNFELHSLLANFTDVDVKKWYNQKSGYKNEHSTRDHMISKEHGYWFNIDTYLMSHPANCLLMKQGDNASKNDRCSITLNELIERVEFFNECILEQKVDPNATVHQYKLNPNLSKEELKHYFVLSMCD